MATCQTLITLYGSHKFSYWLEHRGPIQFIYGIY